MVHIIPDYDWSYAHQEWKRGLKFYQERLKQIGFDKINGLVLDVGCGTGQWMDTLTSFDKEVVGIDVRKSRIEIASIFLNKDKTHLVIASANSLPFRDNIFSASICYGVIMFTDEKKTLKEINRVLSFNSLFYLCWNAIGWSIRLVFKNILRNRSIVIQALCTILKRKGSAKYFAKKEMIELINRLDFKILFTDGEGLIGSLSDKFKVYNKRFLLFDNVLEALVEKVKS